MKIKSYYTVINCNTLTLKSLERVIFFHFTFLRRIDANFTFSRLPETSIAIEHLKILNSREYQDNCERVAMLRRDRVRSPAFFAYGDRWWALEGCTWAFVKTVSATWKPLPPRRITSARPLA